MAVLDGECLYNEGSDAFDEEEVSLEMERIVNSYFERGEPEEQVIDLQTVYALLSKDGNDSILKNPPQDFDLKLIINNMKIKEPLSEFAKHQNEQLEKSIQDNEQTALMGQILSSRAASIVVEDSICNPDEIRISQKQWTVDTRELYLLITQSASFLRDLQLFFETKTLSPV